MRLVAAPVAGVCTALLRVPGWTQQLGNSKLQSLGEAAQGNGDLEVCRSATCQPLSPEPLPCPGLGCHLPEGCLPATSKRWHIACAWDREEKCVDALPYTLGAVGDGGPLLRRLAKLLVKQLARGNAARVGSCVWKKVV